MNKFPKITNSQILRVHFMNEGQEEQYRDINMLSGFDPEKDIQLPMGYRIEEAYDFSDNQIGLPLQYAIPAKGFEIVIENDLIIDSFETLEPNQT